MIKVKPLDWRAYGNQHLSGWQGMGRMGALYYITDTGPDGEGKGGWWYKDEWFETAEAAKSAAQADYESRVLSALSVSVPAQEAEPVAWQRKDMFGKWITLPSDWTEAENLSICEYRPLYLHPTPAHSGEREALERAASQLVNSELAQQIRKLVSGWNGDGVAEEYRMGRHDDALGVTLPTNCGAIYMLDEVIHELRAALEGKQP